MKPYKELEQTDQMRVAGWFATYGAAAIDDGPNEWYVQTQQHLRSDFDLDALSLSLDDLFLTLLARELSTFSGSLFGDADPLAAGFESRLAAAGFSREDVEAHARAAA